MIIEISRDLEARPVGAALTVTLGDYIDRGADSRGVLDRLVRNPLPTSLVNLKGNHESLLLVFLKDPSVAGHWRRLGGLGSVMVGKNYEEAAADLRARIPPTHVDFLKSLRTRISVGKYFMCHAGVRPGVPRERQSEEDLLWIREEFLSSRVNFGKIVVVHGHTPTESSELLPIRINIDTGAFMTGRLTCAVLDQGEPRFLSTN
jgi:serine/threonine protein phosphatase 1